MNALLFWQTMAYLLLVALMAGYTLLDGYDLGLGMVLPFFPRNQDKRTLLNALAPFWDGNEVWLIISAGMLFAAFPSTYAAVFTGFYPYAILLLFVLILRATAFEFWFHTEKHQVGWETIFSLSSLGIPLLLGLLAGHAVLGVPLTNGHHYAAGKGPGFFRLFPWLTALTGVGAMLFQGLAFAAGRTQQDLQKSILRLARILAWVYLAVMLLFIATEYSNLPWAAVLGFGPVTRWPSLLGPRASCAFASKRPSAFCFFPL